MKHDNTGAILTLDKANERTFDLHNGINELHHNREMLLNRLEVTEHSYHADMQHLTAQLHDRTLVSTIITRKLQISERN